MKKFKHHYDINNQEDEDASAYPLYAAEKSESQKTTGKAKTDLSSVTDHTSSTRKIRDWQKADSRANNNLGEPIIRID
jgi:hypothetical protein